MFVMIDDKIINVDNINYARKSIESENRIIVHLQGDILVLRITLEEFNAILKNIPNS